MTESGKIVSADGAAIYAAGYGTYNIAGPLSGTEFGIEIRAGKLNVEDTAKISATGNFSDPVQMAMVPQLRVQLLLSLSIQPICLLK